MSLLPAFFGARKRDEDLAPEHEPESSSERERDDEAFSLVPPRASDDRSDRLDRLSPLARLGALGAVVQGSATAYDWACKFGWASTYCPAAPPKPPARPDIPA